MNVHVRVLTIGALAKAAGVTTPTIRYYEEIGLCLLPGARPAGNATMMTHAIGRLTFIKQCRDFGFGIDKVRVLLVLSISTERDCAETRDIAQVHLDEVRQKLAELRLLEGRLESFVTRCNVACAGGPGQDWRYFQGFVVACSEEKPMPVVSGGSPQSKQEVARCVDDLSRVIFSQRVVRETREQPCRLRDHVRQSPRGRVRSAAFRRRRARPRVG